MSISATSGRLPASPAALRRLRAARLPRPELLGLLVLAAVLDLWALDRNGWANEYYAAAVRSMSSNWHAFLYNSFDASGVMTVDKPPLSLWVQALSARVFGFSSWSILVPQALMGVATVALAYDIARRRFGRVAGTVAGLVLALTPITVAVSRHNNPDALLVLCVTAAVWLLVRALEDGRTRRLVWCGVAVGLGFETKMGAALLVVPALAAGYLWVAPAGRGRAVRQLVAGGAAMAVVGLAWPVLVWLTPASSRPWVSGTSDNSIWSLILDYNGLGRLDGQAGGPGGAGPGGGGGPGGGLFGGATGPSRLLNAALGGQAGWLLGVALASAVGLLVATRLRRSDPRTGWLLVVGGAFVTIGVAFSTASGIFHPYYVSELAPFTALLAGAAVPLVLGTSWGARALAVAAVLAGVVVERKVLHDNPTSLTWLPGVLAGGGAAGAAAIAALPGGRVRTAVLAATAALLLVAPATWSAQTLGHATSGTFPAGGPATTSFGPGGMRGGFAGPGGVPGRAGGPPPMMGAGPGATPGPGGMFSSDTTALTEAVTYAAHHGGGSVAVSSQSGAAGAVITSGADVVALGGFSGRESEVSPTWLAQAVRDGRVRFVIADAGGLPMDSRTGSRAVMSIVRQACTPVTLSSGTTLYDCHGAAAAISGHG